MGEAAALLLALATFSRILKNHHFYLYSDALSLLYLKGLRSMQGQLWRLFEKVAKHSFTISHLKSQDNVLADRGGRRTNLIELTDEEKELFGDVIEECEDECEGAGGAGAGNLASSRGEKRKKGEPRQRPPMTAEQIARCKAQQLKQLVYADRLNKGLPLDLGEHTYHMDGQEEESVGGNEQLACLQECGHQRAWLPLPGGKAERVCVTRRGQRNCVERELGGFKPCAREAREMPRLVSVI